MNNFLYCAPTKYVFGRGAEEQAGSQMAELGATKALIVYGRGSAVRSGLLGRIKDSLAQAGIAACELGGVKPNPEDDLVYDGIAICREHGVDAILAVGGGSVIDTAKAIAAGTLYDGDFWDFYSGAAKVEKALPIGVVLTIPAAGSEGSGNTVITKRDGMVKISIRTDYLLRPKFSLLNPELTFTLPPEQTAAGIADMMAHIMERYFTNTADVEVTDRLCEGLLMAIMDQAHKVMADPRDYDARANIMWSGTLAHNGICGCGREEDWSSHAIEHELSALYGVTHGAGLAVVFPAWMTYVAERHVGKVAQFARRVFAVNAESDVDAAFEGIARLRSFFASIGLPLTLKDLGINDPDIDALVRRLHEHKGQCLGFYYPLAPADTRAIYQLMI
ncbi:MAG: iron-containing alcohol dehydrogenase [Muribaculaceae bacterium]|nr:iron-containing alcohol dehydrogenase [Muribaculaceae bacterium]